jgi:hypothetical protein
MLVSLLLLCGFMSSDNAGRRRKVQKFLHLKPPRDGRENEGRFAIAFTVVQCAHFDIYELKGGSCAAEAIRHIDAQLVGCDRFVVYAWDHW